jgi:hypothetical protein
MVYFCLDCEASGQVPPFYNLLSIGVTVVRPENGHHTLGDTFYAELKPIFPGFDPKALAVCGLNVERLRKDGEDPEQAMRRLSEWILKQNSPSEEYPIFVGHNAVFDWAYIAYYYAKSLAMGRLRIPWSDTSKENLERLLSLPAQDPAQIHRADYDSWYQALILKALLDDANA